MILCLTITNNKDRKYYHDWSSLHKCSLSDVQPSIGLGSFFRTKNWLVVMMSKICNRTRQLLRYKNLVGCKWVRSATELGSFFGTKNWLAVDEQDLQQNSAASSRQKFSWLKMSKIYQFSVYHTSVPSMMAVCRKIGPALWQISSTGFVRMNKKRWFFLTIHQFSVKLNDLVQEPF